MKVRVYYEDTDAGGIVYHSKYINFCERARSEAFFKNGLTPERFNGGHFIVKKLEANYISAAKLGDELEISCELQNIKSASLEILQKIYKNKKVIFKMNITIVYINFEGKPQKMDTQTIEALKSLF